MRIKFAYPTLALASQALAQSPAQTSSEQSFLANGTSYTLFCSAGLAAQRQLFNGLARQCRAEGNLDASTAHSSAPLWLVNDADARGYQLWTSEIDTSPMQLCLTQALPELVSAGISQSQLVRTFVADAVSYGLYATEGVEAALGVLSAMQAQCQNTSLICMKPAPHVPNLHLASDDDGVGYELWASSDALSSTSFCLIGAMQVTVHDKYVTQTVEDEANRRWENGIYGSFFGAILGLGAVVGSTIYFTDDYIVPHTYEHLRKHHGWWSAQRP